MRNVPSFFFAKAPYGLDEGLIKPFFNNSSIVFRNSANSAGLILGGALDGGLCPCSKVILWSSPLYGGSHQAILLGIHHWIPVEFFFNRSIRLPLREHRNRIPLLFDPTYLVYSQNQDGRYFSLQAIKEMITDNLISFQCWYLRLLSRALYQTNTKAGTPVCSPNLIFVTQILQVFTNLT